MWLKATLAISGVYTANNGTSNDGACFIFTTAPFSQWGKNAIKANNVTQLGSNEASIQPPWFDSAQGLLLQEAFPDLHTPYSIVALVLYPRTCYASALVPRPQKQAGNFLIYSQSQPKATSG